MNEPHGASNDALLPRQRRQCSRCGAYAHNDDQSCWFCKRSFSGPAAPPLKPLQFSLATLLGAMTVVAAALGLYLFSPPVAIGLFGLCGAAVVRMWVVERMHAEGGVSRWRTPLWQSFLVSLAIVFWTAASFVAVLSLGCFVSVSLLSSGGGPLSSFALWPVALGLVVALTFAAVLLWSTRDLPD